MAKNLGETKWMFTVVAEVAPSHSRSLSHSPNTGHCPRGLTWATLGTRDEMLGSEQLRPVGETGHKETMTREGGQHRDN